MGCKFLWKSFSSNFVNVYPKNHLFLYRKIIRAVLLQMIDVKNNIHYPSGYPMSQHPPVFLCSSPGPDPYCSQDLYNPVYEELSDADSEMTPAPHSEDEFAEDELSLAGEMERRRLDMQPPAYRTEPVSFHPKLFRWWTFKRNLSRFLFFCSSLIDLSLPIIFRCPSSFHF